MRRIINTVVEFTALQILIKKIFNSQITKGFDKELFFLFTLLIYCGSVFAQCIPTVGVIPGTPIGVLNLQLNGLNHDSDSSGYEDYRDSIGITTTLAPSGIYNVIIKGGYGDGVSGPKFQHAKAWLDANQDTIFDPSEEVFYIDSMLAFTPISGSLIVPSSALSGNTVLRIATTVQTATLNNPCDITLGNVDDYTISIAYNNMIFNSYTVEQVEIPSHCLIPPEKDVAILKIPIIMEFTQNPLDLTSITVNTNGTTNTMDIDKATIYYTGNSNSYATGTVFGSINSPGTTDFIINGIQTLLSDTNFFWLAYDINASATAGNLLDGECVSVTIDGLERIPVTSAPNKFRTVDKGSDWGLTKTINTWYFGDHAGIDFNCDPPKPLINSALYSEEATSSVSDSNGNILFYSNGIYLFDASHDTMSNGSGLMSNDEAAQSSLAVKQPGNNNLYYLFTVDDKAGNNGFRYSVIDMDLPGNGTIMNPLGDIVSGQKNLLLSPAIVTESMNATLHKNGADIWIVVHEYNTNSFYAYLLTSSGLSSPVISNVGLVPSGARYSTVLFHSQINFSPNGKKLMMSLRNVNGFDFAGQLFDFDNNTGIFSNPLKISFTGGSYNSIFGAAFSSNNTKLYVSHAGGSTGRIYQYDLTCNDSASIVDSRTLVYNTTIRQIEGMQLAPDGKIYVAQYTPNYGYEYTGVINNPNRRAPFCDFVPDGFYLDGRFVQFGFPNIINSYLNRSTDTTVLGLDFTASSFCLGDTTRFNSIFYGDLDTLIWDFGDGTFAYIDSPAHIYSQPGVYSVSVIASENCISDTITKNVTITSPSVTIGNDDTICPGDSILLDAGTNGQSYLWSTGDTSQNIIVMDTGIYWISLTDANDCITTDSILVVTNDSCIDIMFKKDIFVPNAFSPDNDNKNDLFIVRNSYINEFYLIIYNRWGNKIFDTNSAKEGWNGTNYKDEMVNAGTYTYYLHVVFSDNTIIEQNGNITLVR